MLFSLSPIANSLCHYQVGLYRPVLQSARFLLLFILLSMLNACGFQLRGALEISPDVAPIYLQINSLFVLGKDVKDLLENNDVAIVDDAKQANATLILNNETKQQRVLSVDANGRAREYLLSYTVDYSVQLKNQKAIAETLSLKRSLLFDAEAVIAVANESELLYKDMQRDAARLILLKLQAHSKNRPLQASVDTVINKPEVVKF